MRLPSPFLLLWLFILAAVTHAAPTADAEPALRSPPEPPVGPPGIPVSASLGPGPGNEMPESRPGVEPATPVTLAEATGENGSPWWTVGTPFILRARHHAGELVTEEYGRGDEDPDRWTERLTYQRLSLSRPTASDAFVALLKEQLATQGASPRLRLVRQGKTASVFGIHYAATPTREEQFSVVLVAIPDPQHPSQVHLVEYLISPARLAPEAAEVGVKRWQARFLSQASALER